MKLHHLLDEFQLQTMIVEGYVNTQFHPTEPLCILSYTKKTVWERKWNDVTLKCRGLIYNHKTMDVIARPFEKFFNYEEIASGLTGLVDFEDRNTGPVQVTDKMDGSLGIIYTLPSGGYAVATRGSFTSDQAIHASWVLNERYVYLSNLSPEMTYLVEIIYPENRIVLNYGDMDDLVLLGGVIIDTGLSFGPDLAKRMTAWKGPVAQVFPAVNWAAALAMAPRENAEGVVVHFLDTDERVKLKQADYVALHRIVTGLTDRVIWEAISSGQSVDQIKEPLPEEFHQWVDDVVDRLAHDAAAIIVGVMNEFHDVLVRMPAGWERKDFALAIKDSPNRALLFLYLDGKPVWDVVWKSIKPEAGRSMTSTTLEDE